MVVLHVLDPDRTRLGMGRQVSLHFKQEHSKSLLPAITM
jgi:hypothetical protein